MTINQKIWTGYLALLFTLIIILGINIIFLEKFGIFINLPAKSLSLIKRGFYLFFIPSVIFLSIGIVIFSTKFINRSIGKIIFLYQSSQNLITGLAIEKMISKTLGSAAQLFPKSYSPCLGIALINKSKDRLNLRYCWNGNENTDIPGKEANIQLESLPEDWRSKIFQQQSPLIIQAADKNYLPLQKISLFSRLQSILVIPLLITGQPGGIFTIGLEKKWRPSADEVRFFSTLANLIASALNRAMQHRVLLSNLEELKRLNLVKSNFLSLVSHELRTPLTSIKGYTELILDGRAGEITALQKNFLQIVSDQTNNLTQLISELLNLSRIESGQMKMQRVSIPLSAFIQEQTEKFYPQIRKKEIVLTVQIEPDLPSLYADHLRLSQVFNNILTNALKFTPAGGEIKIQAQRFSDNTDYAEIKISDTGAGMPREELEKIFDKFYQIDSYINSKSGIGLGLSICKEIISAHGGEISASSLGKGKGSAFQFTLPFFEQKGEKSCQKS
ncbi:MAG: ATP-binding protein [Elusimicrobiota bacterium]